MDKELLINELTIALSDSVNIPLKEVSEIITSVMSDYSVSKMQTTLPSVGDGAASLYLFESFMEAKVSEGASKGTLKQYHNAIKSFYNYTGKELNMVKSQDIIKYLDYYRFSGKNGAEQKPNTVKNRYLQLSAFYSWLFANKYINENIFASLKIPKGNIPNKEIISKEEMDRMTTAVLENRKPQQAARDLALIYFLSESGVRVSELCNLTIGDVNFDNKTCSIIGGKGNKNRMVYFGNKSLSRLLDYFNYRDDIKVEDGKVYADSNAPLFASFDKNHHKLDSDSIRKEIDIIAELSDIPKLHPHLFRSSMATNMIDNNVSPNVVKTLLGHSSLTTMESYVNLTSAQIQAAIKDVI